MEAQDRVVLLSAGGGKGIGCREVAGEIGVSRFCHFLREARGVRSFLEKEMSSGFPNGVRGLGQVQESLG